MGMGIGGSLVDAARVGVADVALPLVARNLAPSLEGRLLEGRSLGGRSLGGRSLAAWRCALLGGAAIGALSLLPGPGGTARANDACSTAGNTVTCSGDQSGGIDITAPNNTLNVLDLTADIEPASGVSGIAFNSNGAITVTSNTSTYGIVVVGANADGIHLVSTGGSVTLDHTGDVSSGSGAGIYVSGNTVVSVTSNGAIESSGDGIYANSNTNKVTVNQTGNVTSSAGRGIYASGNNVVSVTGNGVIQSSGDGIYANSNTNKVTVNQTGNVTSSAGRGIYASGLNVVSVTGNGVIQASGDGIYANSSTNSATVNQTGNVTSSAGRGIYASGNNAVSVTGNGVIQASGDAIYANSSTNNATVNQTGNVTSSAGRGIYASGNNTVSITSNGIIDASGDAIYANSNSVGASINQTGDVTSHNGLGLYANGHSNVSITSSGKVDASGDAVYANSDSSSAGISQTGDVTSHNGRGLYVHGNSTVSITSSGKVDAYGDAMTATSDSSSATISQTGDVTSHNGRGLTATGKASVSITNSSGKVDAYGNAITATSETSTASISQTGDVTSATGYGLYATGKAAVSITGSGIVEAALDGIHAESANSPVTVTWGSDVAAGDITSTGGIGIYAASTKSTVTITSTGDIWANGNGIQAATTNSSISITHVGDITSATDTGISTSAHGAITIDNTGDISAVTVGIWAQNNSSGAIGIKQTGKISSDGQGISVATTGDVTVTVDGDVTAGTDGIAISSPGTKLVTVNGGTIQGANSGVYLSQGGSDSLVNYGTIKNSGGILADAIVSSGNVLAIDNYGTVAGNVNLSSSANTFVNHADSVFLMGPTVDLGNGGLLTNDGTLSPGGAGLIVNATLTGGLANNANSLMIVDVDWNNGAIDRIDASNGAALAGKMQVHLVSLPTYGASSLAFVTAGDGVTGQTMTVINPVLGGSIVYPDANTAALSAALDFSPDGVGTRAAGVGNYLNRAYEWGGVSPTSPYLLALANMTSVGAVDNALQQLVPDIYVSEQMQALYRAGAFTDGMMSCKVADGVATFAAEGQCAWARIGGGRTTYAPSGGRGYDEHAWEFAGGVQTAISKDLRLGFAGGFVQSRLNQGTSKSDGQAFEAGGVLKYVPGQLMLAAAVTGTYGWSDTTRSMDFDGFSERLSGKSKVATVDTRARVAYTFQDEHAYLKPWADIDAIYVTGSATEAGGSAALKVDGSDKVVFSVTPGLEVGGEFKGDGVTVRPYVRGAVSFYSDRTLSADATLLGDNSGAPGFTVTSTADRTLYKLSGGVDVIGSGGTVVRAYYDGMIGDTIRSHSGGIRASTEF